MRGNLDKKGPSLAWAKPIRCPWRCPRECPGVGNGTTFLLQLGQCEVPQGETDLPCPALAHNHLSFLARLPVTRTPGREVWFLVSVAPSLTPIPSMRQGFLLSSHFPLWGLPSVPDCHIHHCWGGGGVVMSPTWERARTAWGPSPPTRPQKPPSGMLFNPATGFSFSGLCAGPCQILELSLCPGQNMTRNQAIRVTSPPAFKNLFSDLLFLLLDAGFPCPPHSSSQKNITGMEVQSWDSHGASGSGPKARGA